jgi:antitoxin ParD1/3/4
MITRLAKIAKNAKLPVMTTMNISLPDSLKAYVDTLVQTEGYGTSSEYMRELIRQDQDKRQFKEHLMAGMRSGVEGAMDADFFAGLRKRVSESKRA